MPNVMKMCELVNCRHGKTLRNLAIFTETIMRHYTLLMPLQLYISQLDYTGALLVHVCIALKCSLPPPPRFIYIIKLLTLWLSLGESADVGNKVCSPIGPPAGIAADVDRHAGNVIPRRASRQLGETIRGSVLRPNSLVNRRDWRATGDWKRVLNVSRRVAECLSPCSRMSSPCSRMSLAA